MPEKASTKPKKKRLSPLWSLLLVLVLASVWLVGDMLHFIRTPASSEPAEVVMEVPVGTSVQALSDLLYGQGLVRSAGKFRWLVRFKGAARQIKAGEYQLSTGLRPGELLNKIIRGEVRLHQITFPEGYTLKQMAELLEASKLANAERFVAAATDPSLLRSLGIPAASLEGYLFPDTYRFARGLPVETVLRSFVTMFNQHFGPVQEEQARKLGFTRHQVVILASVVEKETAAAEERPLIAGVFL
ncbi:MAG: endolytic transglycosylase MltG, partial [Syntrophobacteria bacterium]